MNRPFLAIPLLLLTSLLACQPLLAETAAPPSSQEEELLSMYFEEEQLVESSSRSLKPLSQVAENVTVVTAKEIEQMRAHTLAEVLSRQPGVFVTFWGQDFLGTASVSLQGSQRHHVLLLLDGVRLNHNSNGFALTSFIPLGIIKRIEIIKGAASSTWGSALGGVINIITKDTGKTIRPSGTIHASYGEADSYELAADAAGRVKALGYYLYAGSMDSDGLRLDRYAKRDTLYGKVQLQLPGSSQLSVTGGYSDPSYKGLNWSDAWDIEGLDLYEELDQQDSWATIFLDTRLGSRTSLHLAAQHFHNSFTINRKTRGSGSGGTRGSLLFGEEWEDSSTNLSARLTWAGTALTANLGLESNHSKLHYQSRMGPFFGGPSTTTDPPVSEDRNGVYANLSYVHGKWTLSPGLRYDAHSNSEESISPSLGATYQLSPETLFRGLVARGFSAPYLAASTHSPELNPENIWTFQLGLETARIPMLHLKGTIFHHQIEDAWEPNSVPWSNSGSQRLKGFELEARTESFHGLSLNANFTLVSGDGEVATDEGFGDDETYSGNLTVSYDHAPAGLRAELAGRYLWLNEQNLIEEPRHGTWLWDLLLAKELELPQLKGELYLKAHNLFNTSQYCDYEYPNPDRWLEVGLSVRY
ncbi:TonB-dependent receptor plug domain-containing protein [Desulfogranum mediterraneum]|uniref:TonB-dependent receptor plug domain-containing protein n=1 Tax=Desulfogranum mediterraneum TaxID=160661 RepID=UPI000406F380|nr:TonB-dependent receptor [Desulfogranum mediterraneum]